MKYGLWSSEYSERRMHNNTNVYHTFHLRKRSAHIFQRFITLLHNLTIIHCIPKKKRNETKRRNKRTSHKARLIYHNSRAVMVTLATWTSAIRSGNGFSFSRKQTNTHEENEMQPIFGLKKWKKNTENVEKVFENECNAEKANREMRM